MLLVFDVGTVGRVGDIEDKAEIGLQVVGRHRRAMAADFLLHRIQSETGRGGTALGFGESTDHFRNDEPTDAVVEGPTDDTVFAKRHGAIGVDGRMSHADTHFSDFGRARGADVDKELVHLGGLLTVLAIADVDRGVANDAEDLALVAEDGEASSARVGPVRSANAVDAEETIVGDVFDDEADLVGMRLDHDSGCVRLGTSHRGPGVAVSIALDRVSEFTTTFRPDPLPADFETGRAGGVEEFVEEGRGGRVKGHGSRVGR